MKTLGHPCEIRLTLLPADELTKAGTPIVEERPKQLPWMRAKYLHFADNRRPPYYGTWRKRSKLISARHPLGQDKVDTHDSPLRELKLILLIISAGSL